MSGALYTSDKGAQIGITVAITFLILVDLIGNSLIIAIIVINRSMRTPMNLLIINLAVADMMVGVFASPRFVFSHFFTHPDGVAGTMLCKFVTGGTFMWLGGAASVFSLFAVCFERYFSVVHPFSQKLKLTTKKVKIIAIFCWLLATVTLIPYSLGMFYDRKKRFCMETWLMFPSWIPKAYSLYWLLAYGAFPALTMFILYSRVIYKLWFKKLESEGTQLAVLKSRKRITKMVITVSIIYGLTWLPELTIYTLAQHLPAFSVGDVTYISSVVLVTCNSAINPFVYALQNEKFRRHMWDIVCCRRLRNNAVANSNSSAISKRGGNDDREARVIA